MGFAQHLPIGIPLVVFVSVTGFRIQQPRGTHDGPVVVPVCRLHIATSVTEEGATEFPATLHRRHPAGWKYTSECLHFVLHFDGTVLTLMIRSCGNREDDPLMQRLLLRLNAVKPER